MRGRWRRVWMLLLVATLLAGAVPLRPVAAAPPAPVEVLRSDRSGIDLRIRVPAYQVEPVTLEGRRYDRVQIPGYALGGAPGDPALPERGVLLGIPAGVEPVVRLVRDERQTATGLRIAPAPVPEVADDLVPEPAGEDRLPALPRQVFREDTHAYAAARLDPAAPVEIAEAGFLRDQRYVKLLVQPVQYAPATGEIVYHSLIDVRLEFSGSAVAAAGQPPRPESEPFEALLRATILNYDSTAAWRSAPPLPGDPSTSSGQAPAGLRASAATSSAPASQTSWKMAVRQEGIYRLSHDDLAAAGVLQDVPDPRSFKVYSGTREIPIHVTGESDGAFDPGDQLLFYGQPADTKYSDTNVYWLTTGGGAGRRMSGRRAPPDAAPVRPAFTTRLHLEENTTRLSTVPWREDHDHWFWNFTLPPGVPSQSYPFTLPHPSPSPYTATLRIAAVGRTPGGHQIEVRLNGQPVGEASWSGLDEQRLTFPVASSVLASGSNTLTIVAPGTSDGAHDQTYYDWFELDYRRTFDVDGDTLTFTDEVSGGQQYALSGFTGSSVTLLDVTDPYDPVRLTSGATDGAGPFTLRFQDTRAGRRTYATSAAPLSPAGLVKDTPSSLRETANGADYLIISHADFITAVQPLATYRAGQGLRVRLIDVQDVYDEFNAGVLDPRAIRDFLAYAYAAWTPPAPGYVLLVGEGNWDPRRYLANTRPAYIPPYLLAVDPWLYEVPAENRFVTVSGDDDLPDLYLGRFPVGSVAQAEAMVAKVLAYEQSTPAGEWRHSTLWVTDNAPDSAGDFYTFSDGVIAASLPAGYQIERVYLGQNYTYENPAVAAKAAVIEAIARGQLLVSYTGHAAYNYWGQERLLSTTEAEGLTNGGRLPVWLAMTCWTGSFHVRDSQAMAGLDPALVRTANGGAIASFSPTGLGVASGHDHLHRGFLDALFRSGMRRMGQAALAAKLNLYTNTSTDLDLLNTFTVLGDPALHVAIPTPFCDLNGNGQVDAGDIQMVAGRWRQRSTDPGWDPRFDLDGDGDIDLLDAMRVAVEWQRVCSS